MLTKKAKPVGILLKKCCLPVLWLAVAGAFMALGGVLWGATAAIFNFTAAIGTITAVDAFVIGSLAFDFTALVVAPLYGIEMEPIELGEPNPYQDNNDNEGIQNIRTRKV